MNLSFRNVGKHFGSVVALDGITFTIQEGELFFLLGPSGCGKTTLLRCLGGFEKPTSGCILFNGVDVTDREPNERNTAMVFQGYALWPHLTVAENVAFGLAVKGIPEVEKNERVSEALRLVRIGELADRKPNELSGGQQQRVALARMLVVKPGCLLLDEPLANLDAKLRRDMRSEIREICRTNGLTAVYVTHDRQEALSMADRIAVMQAGKVLQIGPPREIYELPVNQFVADLIGEANKVPGTVKAMDGDLVTVDTLFGMFGSSLPHVPLKPGQAVLLLLRPEAVRRGTALQNNFAGTVESTTYLGEMAEHVVRVHDGQSLKTYEINPKAPPEPGDRLELNVAPDSVIVLPVDHEKDRDQA